MFGFLPSLPGVDDVRGLVNRVDTARHHGVPNGCVLEFDLRSVPPETTGFDPLAIITGGRPMVLRDTVAAIHRAAEDPRVAGLIAHVQLRASPPAAVQELREAIAAFSAVKPSLAWAETYPGTMSYYLASAFGKPRADRLRQQRDVPARRARQGGHRSPVRRARRIQVGGKPFHRGWLHRRPPRGRDPDAGKPARTGVAGGRRVAQGRSGCARQVGGPGPATAR